MTELFQVFLLAMTPVGELRLAIPMGILVFHLSAVSVFFVSVMGNLVPAIFILFFLNKISVFLSNKSLFFKKIFGWWENNARKKHLSKIQEYDAIGLALFVAVPLPLTGAWTGALLATLMNLPLKKSISAIFLGVIGAGIIVTVMVVFGINIEKYLGWQTLLGVLLILVLGYMYFKYNKKHDGGRFK